MLKAVQFTFYCAWLPAEVEGTRALSPAPWEGSGRVAREVETFGEVLMWLGFRSGSWEPLGGSVA